MSAPAILFDTSSAGKLRLTGPDAPAFLSNLSTNDIKAVPLGGGCETYFCDHRAKALFQAWVYHILLPNTDHALWLETTPGRNELLFKHLDRYLISEQVEIEDVTAAFAQFHLPGMNAKAVLEKLTGPVPELAEFQHLERTIAGVNCSIRRRDPLGTLGYDIVCEAGSADRVREALDTVGVWGSPQDYERLRINAGTPLHGPDIDENRFVMEVGNVARAVSYTKGCYLGQEPIVMSRDRAGHAPRAFVKLTLAGDAPPAVGTKILAGEEEAGAVTSSARATRTDGSVALGYVRWKHREPGTVLSVDGRPATIV
jgi:tRNA-modifying protein YgfZ